MPLYAKRIFQVHTGKGWNFRSTLPLRSLYTSKKHSEEHIVFTGSEVRTLYNIIRDKKRDQRLNEIMTTNGVDTSDDVLAMLESKINDPRVLPFSWIKDENLEYLNLRQHGSLTLKPNYKELMDTAGHIGNEDWSSEALYRHICMLHNLVPAVNEGAARLWINTFFFRAAAMLPKDKKMVLNVEHAISATTVNPHSSTAVLRGFTDYIAMMATPTDAECFLLGPTLEKLKEFKHALFVSEAKSKDVSLEMNIPQAVSEIYACAKELGKTTIRGALSDGQNWIFVILKINSDGHGAKYAVSKKIPLINADCLPELMPSHDTCTLIAGIISYWIEQSHKDIDDKDWFTISWY